MSEILWFLFRLGECFLFQNRVQLANNNLKKRRFPVLYFSSWNLNSGLDFWRKTTSSENRRKDTVLGYFTNWNA
jgi:hypothetical protein